MNPVPKILFFRVTADQLTDQFPLLQQSYPRSELETPQLLVTPDFPPHLPVQPNRLPLTH